MGITRTVDWKLRCSTSDAIQWVQHAMAKAELGDVSLSGNQVHAEAKRSLRKNRWGAEVTATVNPLVDGSEVVWQVVMSGGTKHFEVLDDIWEHVPGEVFDDQGITSAVERFGKARPILRAHRG